MRKEILLTAFAALLMQPLVAQEKKSPSFDEVLTTRRSIRSYDATKKISEQEVRTLMEAVQEAPSWANQQPSKYYVAMTPKNSLLCRSSSVATNVMCREHPYSSYPPSNVARVVFSKAILPMR